MSSLDVKETVFAPALFLREMSAARKKLIVSSCSLLLLVALGVRGFSLALLIFSILVQWLLYRGGRHGLGVMLQALLLAVLKVGEYQNVLPDHRFPLGFSFFSLSIIALQVDAARVRSRAFLFSEFFLFSVYLPKFFAGPIERADRFVREAKFFTATKEDLRSGSLLFVWGAIKKFAIADPLWQVASIGALSTSPKSVLLFLCGLYALAIHFYAEFSGYVDMARGLSRCLGFELSENFDRPFLARNPQDFWRRWHITLSTWLRDYIHYPVFFKTKSLWLAITASFVGMAVWHGLEGNYLVMGVYWSVLMIGYMEIKPVLLRWAPETDLGKRVWSAAAIVLMFHLSCLAFFLLYAGDWWSILHSIDWKDLRLLAFYQQYIARISFFVLPFLFFNLKRIPSPIRFGLLLYFVFLVFFFEGGPLWEQSEAQKVAFMYFQF